MKTFILFIFGMFEDHEDVEFFCTEVLGDTKSVKSLRYVIENSQNIIVIFDSDTDYYTLSKDLFESLSIENVKFYFLIERDTLVTAHLPAQVKDFIFKPQIENSAMILEYTKKEEDTPLMDLDEVLEKIEKWGIESLSVEEKNFLDNFE
jgi:hypothetical protein